MKGKRFDFSASFISRDPFGGKRTEIWLAEVKLYRDQRVTVSVLSEFLSDVRMFGGATKGLIVTNSRLTSAAREFLSDLVHTSGPDIRVIDETELTSLLFQQPNLIRRYFPRKRGRE